MAPTPPRQVSDPRTSARYHADVPLEFSVVLASGVTVSGAARTVNLSTCGVLFESTAPLPPGLRIKVCIQWRARPGSAPLVRLDETGLTVYRRGNATAIAIEQCEFGATPNPPTERAMGNPGRFPAVGGGKGVQPRGGPTIHQITLIADNAVGYKNDHGPGVNVGLCKPAGMTLDGAADLFVANYRMAGFHESLRTE